MLRYKTIVRKFASQGEKTGWTYIEVPAKIAQKLNPGSKKSFRVKGRLDDYPFENVALLPMREGNFIMAMNASVRKATGKSKGAMIVVEIERDDKPVVLAVDLMKCLADEPNALAFFNTLTAGHKNYFNNWIESAKSDSTKANRIAKTIMAMIKKIDFGAMIREIRAERKHITGR